MGLNGVGPNDGYEIKREVGKETDPEANTKSKEMQIMTGKLAKTVGLYDDSSRTCFE